MEELVKKAIRSINLLDVSCEEVLGYIELFQDKIKSICKRKDFPEELNYMCVEFARKSYLYYANKNNSSNEQLQVTSASDNGQSVSFKTVEIITKEDVDIDKVIEKNIAEIRNYAYMEWKL